MTDDTEAMVERLRKRAAGFDDAHARSLNGDYAAHAETDREAAAIIERLQAQLDERRWIPCSERLPEKTAEYLITAVMASKTKVVRVDRWVIGQWASYGSYVGAWRELDKPYEG